MGMQKFAQKILDDRQRAFEYGQKFGVQRACDFIALVLNDSSVMGSHAMSGEKIDRIISTALSMADDEYFRAYQPKDPECDYWQAKLDEAQKRIFKDKFVPFQKRYPYMKAPK